jgi:hypothetical protein
MRLILLPIATAAWWNTRRVRRATEDLRKANYYAARSLRTLIAVGLAPWAVTPSGVPAIPPLPTRKCWS